MLLHVETFWLQKSLCQNSNLKFNPRNHITKHLFPIAYLTHYLSFTHCKSYMYAVLHPQNSLVTHCTVVESYIYDGNKTYLQSRAKTYVTIQEIRNFTEYSGAAGTAARAPGQDKTTITLQCTAAAPPSILLNRGKTEVLPVLPPMAPLVLSTAICET